MLPNNMYHSMCTCLPMVPQMTQLGRRCGLLLFAPNIFAIFSTLDPEDLVPAGDRAR